MVTQEETPGLVQVLADHAHEFPYSNSQHADGGAANIRQSEGGDKLLGYVESVSTKETAEITVSSPKQEMVSRPLLSGSRKGHQPTTTNMETVNTPAPWSPA